MMPHPKASAGSTSLGGALLLLAWVAAGPSSGATYREDFSSDPARRGWRVAGESTLFVWDAARPELQVTWDSSQPNSYFYRPLGTILAKDDAFSLGFDLRLDDVVVGVNPDKPFTFEIALAFLNLASATNPNWRRGAGRNQVYGPRNLVEFDYFPDSGHGATISPTLVSSNNGFATSFSVPFELDPRAQFHVEMSYDPAQRVLSTRVTRNGAPFGPIQDTLLDAAFTDFRCDTFAVASYSDAGAGGSLLAHGVVDNVGWTVPEPVRGLSGSFSNGVWQAQFGSRLRWLYTLERTTDWRSWTAVPPAQAGNGGVLTLTDPAPPGRPAVFYRVRAERL